MFENITKIDDDIEKYIKQLKKITHNMVGMFI
jgi:hypothetical protein